MQLLTTCIGTNQVQVEDAGDRPRPTAWYDGVGKRPIINNTAQRLMQGRACIYTCDKIFVVSKHKKRQSDCMISQEQLKATTRGEQFVLPRKR